MVRKYLFMHKVLGRLDKQFSRRLTKFAFKQASQITLRDNQSISLVQEWGIPCHLTADAVWSLNATPLPSEVEKMFATVKSQITYSNKTIVGLSLREDAHLQKYHLRTIADILPALLPPQSAIVLLDLQGRKDHPPLRQMESMLQNSGLETFWLHSESFSKPSQWLSLMENIDLVIGMRFHALLMALKANKPVLGIAYNPKVSQLLENFGQPLLSLNVSKTECESIWQETLKQFIANKEKLADLAKEKYTHVKQLADKNLKFLRESVEG